MSIIRLYVHCHNGLLNEHEKLKCLGTRLAWYLDRLSKYPLSVYETSMKFYVHGCSSNIKFLSQVPCDNRERKKVLKFDMQ